jgi:hypothetical protein
MWGWGGRGCFCFCSFPPSRETWFQLQLVFVYDLLAFLFPWGCVRIYPLTSPSAVERRGMTLPVVMLLCCPVILGSLCFLCTWHIKWAQNGEDVYVSLHMSDLKLLIRFRLNLVLGTYIKSFWANFRLLLFWQIWTLLSTKLKFSKIYFRK